MFHFFPLRRARAGARLCALFACAAAILAPLFPAGEARAQALDTVEIPGPAGSGEFGAGVTVLPNGNFVVTDPAYSEGGMENRGAAYLYDGGTLQRISTLKGGHADAFTGSSVSMLANGNFVVLSPGYRFYAPCRVATNADAGATTWGSATAGFGAPVVTVAAANSLVGAAAQDGATCESGGARRIDVVALPNGNYVVASPRWHLGNGAVTWADGDGGTVGMVGAGNSLTGVDNFSGVGSQIIVLPNGNYLVSGGGSLTWGAAAVGVVGEVSAANSLVGDAPGAALQYAGTLPVNGNYLARSEWGNGRGALTWGDAAAGVRGVVSPANSLVGGTVGDQVSFGSVIPLANGNYVVAVPMWDNGALADAGAATWGDGTTGITGTITISNSLVGGTAGDRVGSATVALTNGNYVVAVPTWDNGALAEGAGAATWGDGTTGISGTITISNSLVGGTAGDRVGQWGVSALTNGNYAVRSALWDGPAFSDVGAVTWGNGSGGTVGVISDGNSLVGSSQGDQIGSHTLTVLANGNYVVHSPLWDNGGAADAGAATWGDGAGGTVGPVTPLNSLVGGTAGDRVGSQYGTPLPTGNYLIHTPEWDNGGVADAGAVTWGDGATGTAGVVSDSNSLVGGSAGDQIGFDGVIALPGGNYLVASARWDNGAVADAGALTWGDGATGTSGDVSALNSLVGSTANDGIGGGAVVSSGLTILANGNYVLVSRRWDNGAEVDTPAVTWGDAARGVAGPISVFNSLIATPGADGSVPFDGVEALANGNYIVNNPAWNNGDVALAGAVTWGDGVNGTAGPVNAANSLVYATSGADSVQTVWTLANGDYVVLKRPVSETVALLTPGNGTLGTRGEAASYNSVQADMGGGYSVPVAFDPVRDALIVGSPGTNRVIVVRRVLSLMLLTLVSRLEEPAR